MRPELCLGALALALLLPACRRRVPPPPPPPAPPALTLVAVGDIMMHQDVKAAAEAGGFESLWADVEPRLKAADVAFGNLETPVAPAGGRPGRPFVFNAPEALPGALKAAGWTLLSTANNHAFDQGPGGVKETLERLEAAGLLHAGSGSDRTAAERAVVVQRNGLTLGLLAFTDIFNNDLNGAADRPTVRAFDPEVAAEAVRALRPKVDALVVSVHWGNEYQRRPSPRQVAGAEALVAAGADLVLGHHPHVLQPVLWVEAGGRKGLVAYSLGNFISNQDRTYPAPGHGPADGDSRDGALLEVRFLKEAGATHLVAATTHPLWTDNNWRDRAAGREQARRIQVRDLAPGGPFDQAAPALAALRRARIGAILSGTAPATR